jgi:opacity protein-like surface antigen
MESNDQSGIEFGLVAGTNFGSFRGDTGQLGDQLVGVSGSSEFGRRTGFRAGAFLRFDISERFSFRPEAIYSQKGATFEGSGSTVVNGQSVTVEFDVTSRYDYLEIPALLELQIPTDGQIEPYLLAGPTVGFTVSSESEVETTARSGGQSASETETQDADIESTDVSAMLGAGVLYQLNSDNALSLDLRYNPGFASLDSDSDADIQNDVITVGVGFSFDI